ncbi:MAG: CheR family methyltransferase [Longimicrobiales bacterium]
MGWSRPEYGRVAALIAERTGLTFPVSRQQDMERALREAIDDPTSDARVRELLADDTAARDELIASLTVGESYFFRDPGQFRLLREEIVPGLAALRGNAPIRMWSAGCAAGEEAYSLAILGAQLGLRDRTTVLGTDISRVRLAAARRASYTKWALRGLEEDEVERHFTPDGKRWVLKPAYTGRVDFRYLNLAEDLYPSLTAGIWGFDVILCRNVLIYFDRETIARVAERLIASLSEDGWLLLGASDPAIGEFVDCDVVLTPAGLVYRRPSQAGEPGRSAGAWASTRFASADRDWAGVPGPTQTVDPDAGDIDVDAAENFDVTAAAAAQAQPAGPPAEEPAAPVAEAPTGVPSREAPDEAAEAVRAAYAARDYARAATLAEAQLQVHDTADLRVLHVRSLANLGELAAAGRASAAALERHRDSAELLYLHALLLVEAGQWRDAAASARRALYLDRTLIVAHLTLALALKRTGDLDGARRALQNAASLLADAPADAIVPASDGERVGRLRTNVDAQLRLIEGAA